MIVTVTLPLAPARLNTIPSLNILFQEWGNRGIHYWEVGNTNVLLVQGQSEYTFYRSTADGASSTTAGGTSTTSTYGLADILEASYRQNYNNTSQSDSPLTKVDRSPKHTQHLSLIHI